MESDLPLPPQLEIQVALQSSAMAFPFRKGHKLHIIASTTICSNQRSVRGAGMETASTAVECGPCIVQYEVCQTRVIAGAKETEETRGPTEGGS